MAWSSCAYVLDQYQEFKVTGPVYDPLAALQALAGNCKPVLPFLESKCP
jgi:hypothetical protein